MRKDPPFDLRYVYATHLLSLVRRPTLVVNDPQTLRDDNEKLVDAALPRPHPRDADLQPDVGAARFPRPHRRRDDRQAARRRRRRRHLPPHRQGPQRAVDPRDVDQEGDRAPAGAALSARGARRRQARDPGRGRAQGRAAARSARDRVARQPARRRGRHQDHTHAARSRDLRAGGADAARQRRGVRRPRHHRPLSHRGEHHEPDRDPRDRERSTAW